MSPRRLLPALRSSAALLVIALLFAAALPQPLRAQRQIEKLGRGVVALRSSATQVYIGWRLLGNDPDDLAFNLYRSANGAAAVKLNASPLAATTDYVDAPADLATTAYAYSVRPVVDGAEVPDTWAHPASAASAFTLAANAPVRQYLRIPLQATPDGALDVKFCWVGDLDGDGEYDFVVDRQPAGETRQFLEAYKRDGAFLWRMNLGPNSTYHYNIEPGSSTISLGHGDNVTVYDMDGDGRAEVVIRTAHGVVFGDGATLTADNNNAQFLSIVDGLTGAERARAPIPAPWLSDGPMNGHMGIVFADGLRPTVLWASKNRRADNGFNGILTAWNYRNGQLTQRSSWIDNGVHSPEGHQIRIGDVDNDGKDEFIDIGYVLDDGGAQQLFNLPEVVHGDRFHTTDIDPDRPGLETFIIQQNNGTGLATALFDAGTGKIVKKWYAGGVVDVGRGVIADIDANARGYEMFSTQPGIFDARGNQLHSARPFPPETIWWNADLNREFVGVPGSSGESPVIDAFNPANPGTLSRLYTIYNEGVYQAYGGRPAFWGDLLGDWREELVLVANDNSELRVYTTKLPAGNRLYTLMHNPQYRLQATTKGYVQSSYVDYFLGNGMTPPPPPPIVDAKLVWRGGAGSATWDAGTTSSWAKTDDSTSAAFAAGDSVRFDLSGDNTTTVTLNGQLTPGAVTVYSPTHYTFDGAAGSLTGAAKLTKAGAGTLTLSGDHTFTGRTTVWDGALVVNGDFQQSPVTVWGGIWGGALANGATGGRLGGGGRFGQLVTLRYRGAIVPGTGMGHAATLTLAGGLTAEDGSALALDLSDDPTGATKPSDRIAVVGDLTLTGKVAVVVKALNGSLAPGTYTLLTYTGTLTGGTANLAVSVPAGTPHTLAAASGAITLTVPVTRAAAGVVWRGSGGTWDLSTSQNWLRDGAPDVFVSGDTVTFDATGAASPTVTLATALPVAGVTVNGTSHYTLAGAGSIAGPGGFTKSGAGTLTLSTTNDYTGPTVIAGGVLAVANLNDGGAPSSLGAASTAASNLVLDGGTLRLTGAQTNTNRSLTLGAAGGTLDVAATGSSLQISGAATGPGALVKSGPGTLIFATANTYVGGTTIAGGSIYLAGATANSSGLGTGAVTLLNGRLTMADVQASETAAWHLIVPAGANARLDADGRCTLTGSLTGSGTFTFFTPYVRTELRGNWSAFSGRINVVSDDDGGDFRVGNTFGFGNAALNLGDQIYAYYNTAMSGNLTLDIGELSGVAASSLRGGPTAGRTLTWRIGGKNTNSTYAGPIANGTGVTAIAKTGTGTLTLSGASTYTGPTTVEAGRLVINGSLGASAVTVQNGGQFGGTGTIAGSVTIDGTHQPAATGNIAGPLAYGATARIAAEFTANGTGAGTFDKVSAGSVTIAPGAALDLIFNATGSTVDFANAFWTAPRSWTVLTSSARTGTFALGTVSTDTKGVDAATRGRFTLQQTGNDVSVVWTPRVMGAALEVGSNIVHANGNVYDQSLMTGASASFTADPGQIHRVSFIDLTNDIVQMEFSGAGIFTLTLDNPTGPATPVNYVQPTVQYMKGHASITVADADETTNLSVFSVGRATAVNQALFRDNVAYDGFADIGAIFIQSLVKKFGGLRTANANYFANSLFAGLDAYGVAFSGPIFIGDISAFDSATPELKFGSATDVRITGGDLLQPNNKAIQVDGIAPLQFTAGSNSQGVPQPAQPNRARFEKNGVDVTTQMVP